MDTIWGKIIVTLIGILSAIALGISSWSLGKQVDMLTKIELMDYKISQLSTDKETDAKQDAAILMHWQILSKDKTAITILNQQHQFPPHDWGDIHDHSR